MFGAQFAHSTGRPIGDEGETVSSEDGPTPLHRPSTMTTEPIDAEHRLAIVKTEQRSLVGTRHQRDNPLAT